MTIQASTLRPGLLVALKTSVKGNVQYKKVTIEADHETDVGERLAKWETERRIVDPREHEEATTLRSKARTIISGVCANSAFGLLCPEDKEEELARAVEKARLLADDFNARARLTRIDLYVITGRIAPDDAEAIRAINSEMRDLMDTMQRGLQNLDVQTVRDAANKARNVGQMLSPKAQERVALAIEAARSAARKITKAGETGVAEIDAQTIAFIQQQRTAFLDLDGGAEIEAPVAAEGRAVDLAPGLDPNDPLASDGKPPLAEIGAYSIAEVVDAARKGVAPAQIEIDDDEPRRSAANGYQPEARQIEL